VLLTAVLSYLITSLQLTLDNSLPSMMQFAIVMFLLMLDTRNVELVTVHENVCLHYRCFSSCFYGDQQMCTF